MNDKLTQAQATLSAEHKVPDKQYSELSANYNEEQGQVAVLQADLEKAQIKLATAQNK